MHTNTVHDDTIYSPRQHCRTARTQPRHSSSSSRISDCVRVYTVLTAASVRVTWRTPGVHLCVTRQPGQHTTPLPYTVRLTLRSIRHVFNTHSHRSCTSPNTLNHVRSSVCLSLRTSDVCRSACTTEGGGAAGAVPPALDVLGSTVVVYYAV